MKTDNETIQLKKRLLELADRADTRHCSVFSEFLTMAEQDTLLKMKLPSPVSLFGGYDESERRIACFGELNNTNKLPLTCVRIYPVSKKFAENLSHRDILGSLMNLGLRREMLGDIIVSTNESFLFCMSTVSGYIVEQLDKIKHTSVHCEIANRLPNIVSSPPEDVSFTVASERLDALIAAVYRLSRADSQQLFVHQKVFVNARITENTSFIPVEGDIVSVRGFGRFVYNGIIRETKKGRLRTTVGIYK